MDLKPRSDEDVLASYNVSLTESACHRHVVRYNGPNDPFFLLGDTAWELFHRLDEAEALAYLHNRKEKGFNWVMAVVLAENNGLTVPNRYGHLPLHTDHNGQPDPTKPNPGYFEFVDNVVAHASNMGITLALVPTWGRYITGGLAGGPVIFDEKNAYTYARFLAERYPFHPFILGGDTNRFWNVKAWELLDKGAGPDEIQVTDFKPVIDAMAQGIVDGENAAKERLRGVLPSHAEAYVPFMTYHSTQGWLGEVPAMASAQFPDVDWLRLDCIQSGHMDTHPMPKMQDHTWEGSSSYGPVRTMYAKAKRPVIDLEAHYESTHHAFDPAQPMWQAADIRNGGYQAIFAGACGYIYGCNSIWQMNSPGSKDHGLPILSATMEWYHELDLPGVCQAAIMRKIFLSLPNYFTRVPDQSVILSPTNDTNDGLAGDKLVSALRADGWAMVHLPYGGDVEVDLRKTAPIKEGWRAWWIDPRTGSRSIAERGEGGGDADGKRRFVAPSGGKKEDDWLLLVEQVWESAAAFAA